MKNYIHLENSFSQKNSSENKTKELKKNTIIERYIFGYIYIVLNNCNKNLILTCFHSHAQLHIFVIKKKLIL